MYKAFYGLNDNPFSIAPNPHYLFLSERHKEALAHLTYGLGETGGFVLLTGEVGTGKTTVSRCLLKQLPENTDTAFILNPSLTELELLASLCDELRIKYGENPSLKQLTDLLSQFLLANHQQKRNTVLIIDEAQHLRSEVLEQLRLLTNLETDTKKLLQVILIGQPELQQLLKRQDLRQLAQRITARYHLLPLSVEELGFYVIHRLQVAGRHEPLFTAKSIKVLHKFSGGIPRLTNLLCERALMAGYGQSKVPIDHKMIRQAAKEVLGEDDVPENKRWPMILAFSLIVAFIAAFYVFQQLDSDAPEQLKQPALSHQSNDATQTTLTPPVNVEKPSISQQVLRSAINTSLQIDTAYAGLLGLWQKQPIIGLTFCQAAVQQGLACYQQQGNWHSVMQLNYPAVVYLYNQQGKMFYGVVVQRDGEQILLQLNEQQFWVDKAWFERHFSGTFEILWSGDNTNLREIGPTANVTQAQWLENSLAAIQKRQTRLLTQFDSALSQHVMEFQRQNGLKADGIAGSQTLVRINLLLSQTGPKLSHDKGYR
ncbi:AAA family ATPase [Shewanella intestini]|uniref:AAA family ATPase n=1 Tax=Shewanella intestini TaxID=2017544 RepID=A0ABS5HXX8_9GAMM|nr:MULTISPECIES: ExeA family protein [Shewanella]MBR9726611.1 AAA family ATPase [Shewanella intestini]MRG34823.1 AAA family ATPase [Shewanella sp. XMDDZSB0408]